MSGGVGEESCGCKRKRSFPGKTPTDIWDGFQLSRDVNTAVMELLIMAYALKTSCARNIIGVIPYFPYSKQSKMRKRGSIVCKLLASMLAKAGEWPGEQQHGQPRHCWASRRVSVLLFSPCMWGRAATSGSSFSSA